VKPLRAVLLAALFAAVVQTASPVPVREDSGKNAPVPVSKKGPAQPADKGFDSLDGKRIKAHVEKLASDEFDGRAAGTEGGTKAREYMERAFRTLGLEEAGAEGFRQPFAGKGRGKSKDKTIELCNVIGMLEGSDPELKKQYVVIGAHFDHLGRKNGRLYPGADDNASGCGTMLEVARAFTLGERPKRSLLFIAFDGEEIGLLGSREFVRKPTVKDESLVAMVNMDMVSRGSDDDIWVCGSNDSSAMKAALEAAAPIAELTLHYEKDREWRHSSDHGPFADAGIPFLYLGVLDHVDYHKPGDSADKVSATLMERVARLIYSTTLNVANAAKAPEFGE
jgi:Zn-dependent M28 family amino/carboxypeptidase